MQPLEPPLHISAMIVIKKHGELGTSANRTGCIRWEAPAAPALALALALSFRSAYLDALDDTMDVHYSPSSLPAAVIS